MSKQVLQHQACYNLLASVVDLAVYDFNEGTPPEKRSAAAFFRSERCEWICKFVGAKPIDVIKRRLNDDPFASDLTKNKPRRRCSPAAMITWGGKSQTLLEWADETGIQVFTLRNRINKMGLCEEVFVDQHKNAKIITWKGLSLNIKQWAKRLKIGPDAFGLRIRQHGVCAKAFTVGKKTSGKQNTP